MILTRQQVADFLARPDVLDPDVFSDPYLNGVITGVEGAITAFLRWNPVLSLHTNEQGVAQYVQNGNYAGRYLVELKNQPLVPGEAPAIFTKFQLRYPLTIPTASDVALDFVKVFNETGQVFCLAPGTVEALTAVTFGYAPIMNRATAVGYVASYAAGYAVGNGSDPLNPLTTLPFTGITPLPPHIRDAAVLLVRERLMYDRAMNAQPDNPNAAMRYRVRVGEREEEYRPMSSAGGPGKLGMGTPLSERAAMLLQGSVKRRLPLFA
jgi:hypothetical protein